MKPSAFSRLFALVLLSFGLVSCGPSRYLIDIDMRQPSKAGVDLAGKNISVVYLDNGRKDNSNFGRGMAEGFAQALENEYNMQDGQVGVYSMKPGAGAASSSRDTMFDILMDTGSDVVFLLDTIKFGGLSLGMPVKVSSPVSADSSYKSSCTLPFTMKLYCYDGMDKSDAVKSFAGSSVAEPLVYSDGKASRKTMQDKVSDALLVEGVNAGKQISASFSSQWRTEQFSIMYFDSQRWYEALEKAHSFKWKEAMDIWMTFVESRDPLKSSCAAYNLAVACHILGNDTLASEWLDRSDVVNPLPAGESLRKRLR